MSLHQEKPLQDDRSSQPDSVRKHFDNLLVQQSNQGDKAQIKTALANASQKLFECGILPALAIKEDSHGKGDSVSGNGTVHGAADHSVYPHGKLMKFERDASGVNKITWAGGDTWQKGDDGKWKIYAPGGELRQTFEGKVEINLGRELRVDNDRDGKGYIYKTDGTTIKHDHMRLGEGKYGGERITEVDYADGTSRRFAYSTNIDDPHRAINPDGSEKMFRVKDRDGTTWLRDENGTFQHFDRTGNSLGNSDVYPSVRGDGTFRITQNSDHSSQLFFANGSKLNYDENGNVTKYESVDGKTKEYFYTKGTINQVKDEDGTTWKRDDHGLFHQYNAQGDATGSTALGSKFIPPTTETELYGESRGILSHLTELLMGTTPKPESERIKNAHILPSDIHQGELGDCYFLSALGSLCVQSPDLIKDMIKKDPNNSGGFIVTFPGKPDQPIAIEAPTQQELERFARNVNGTWVCVLEKAHRQLLAKSNVDNGDDSAKALELLTGKKFETHPIKNNFLDNIVPVFAPLAPMLGLDTRDLLAAKLTRAFENHEEMCVGTPSEDSGNHTLLVPGHAYAVLGYDPVTQRVRLRNPWGVNDPFSPELKSVRQDNPNDKGEFSMSLDEFRQNFEDISVQTS